MRLAHHLVRRDSGIYAFRLVVSADLRAALGLGVIKRSLGTRDPALAKLYAYALSSRYAAAFAALRGRVVSTPPNINDVVALTESGGGQAARHQDGRPMHPSALPPEDRWVSGRQRRWS
ncbi:hypothetical protein SAMN04515660_2929 [Luteibacter sp. 329MFSha]|nr:hypothetical protein SAMN04515660_2929 [Luteibacter sp. 329MFSha]